MFTYLWYTGSLNSQNLRLARVFEVRGLHISFSQNRKPGKRIEVQPLAVGIDKRHWLRQIGSTVLLRVWNTFSNRSTVDTPLVMSILLFDLSMDVVMVSLLLRGPS
jgi:hypothetical protein